jgi:peptidoglycan/xylan/chitin deacetylase (PgdA/CDA1 family)
MAEKRSFRSLCRWLPNGRNAVLQYHSVGDPRLYGNVSPERLRSDLWYIQRHYCVVDLPAVLEDGEEKRVAITFDDGYANFYTEVLPVLKEFDVPATVFISSKFIGDMYPELLQNRLRIDVDGPVIMSRNHLSELVEEPLVTIGNHTRTHPRLATLDTTTQREEIVVAKQELEQKFGIDINRFAFPSSSVAATSLDIVSQTHNIGVSKFGLVTDPSTPELVPRVKADHPAPAVYTGMTNTGNWLARELSVFPYSKHGWGYFLDSQ